MPPDADISSHASNRDLFLAFAKLGVSSFGGGLTGWMMQECVQTRRWLSEAEFLTGLAMAQAMPGVNVVNLPLWIGYRLGGLRGALSAAAGVIVPPMMIVMAMAAIYEQIARYPSVNTAMQGAAAAAIGLSVAMGVRAARRQMMRPATALVLVSVFAAIGILRWPMLAVVGLAAPVSVALAYRRVSA